MINKIIRSKRLYENQLSYGDITSVSGVFEFDDGSKDTISNASKDEVYGKLIQAIFQASNTNNMLIIRDEVIGKNFITSLDYDDDEIQGMGYSIVRDDSDDSHVIRTVNFTYEKNSDDFAYNCGTTPLLTDEQFFTFKKMEKFKFFSDGFSFQSEMLENVSQDITWAKIVELFKNKYCWSVSYNIIGPSYLYTGNKSGDYIYLYAIDNEVLNYVEINYDEKTDQMQINEETETFLVEDNVKTLFGNQSLIGHGNIDLYRHQLTLNYDGEYQAVCLIVYSSSNLNVDSLQDLTTLLKPNSNTLYYGHTFTAIEVYTFPIIYENNVWKAGPTNEETARPESIVTSVSDIVTTI